MSQDPKDERAHRARIDAYEFKTEQIYNTALKEAAELAKNTDYDPSKPFSFSDYPKTKKRLTNLLNEYAGSVINHITRSTTAEWYAAMKKQDTKQPIKDIYNARNREGLKAFQSRAENGLNLSERVWKYTEQFQQEIELALSGGILTGKSAAEIARSVKSQLKEPDKLFRRVRDEFGVLHLSKNAKAYNPGQGVYRSSFKNALRLTRNETNDAYRSADHYRWQNDASVIGFEVKLSNRHLVKDMCDDLKGKYPKSFKFRMWHTNCLCFVVPILVNDEDYNVIQQSILSGKEIPKDFRPEGMITDVPEGFKGWIKGNTKRLEGYKTQPYFIQDNFKGGKISEGLKIEASKAPKAVKTDQQKADIQARWDLRAKDNKLNEVIGKFENVKVEYNEVKLHNRQLDESEIIERVGGGDLTKGSCVSVAFAYAGNKCGFDVLDFRDGLSRHLISIRNTLVDIAESVGGLVVSNTSDFANINSLIKEIKEGKEYIFTCGAHSAILRKSKTGFEYLELQSPTKNGFKALNTTELIKRFGAKKSHTIAGVKVKTRDVLIDIDLLKKNNSFKKLLGYINTIEGQQRKGLRGSVK